MTSGRVARSGSSTPYPGPGEAGHDTWSGDSWQKGGASIWNHGAYDPESNLVYWGTGNPAPDWDGRTRLGDNLYSDSVIALDADTGKLKWHYQFTPHDELDYDSTQVPVLADISWQGKPRKVMLWANRNGLMYVLDRVTGEFLLGKPYVEVNWMDGFDAKGRPHRVPGIVPTPQGTLVRPHVHGAINWAPPAYSPRTGLFYVAHWEHSGIVAIEGQFPQSVGINTRQTTMGDVTLEPFLNNDDEARGVIRAYDPVTLQAGLGIQAGQHHLGRRAFDRRRCGVRRRQGRLLRCAGCEDRQTAVEGRAGRPGQRRRDDLCREWQAVRGDRGGHGAVRVRAALSCYSSEPRMFWYFSMYQRFSLL